MIFQTKHKGTKQLSTVRLTLRPFAPQEAESCLRNWAADEEIYRYLSAQPQTADGVGVVILRRRGLRRPAHLLLGD